MFGPHTRSASWLLAALLLGAGCGAEIGDECSTNVDCSPTGERICDVSQQGGYCTIQGCQLRSCPEEAACIAFYPTTFLSVACDPSTEDAVQLEDATNDCTADEVCLSSGVCALATQEQRFCMRKCGSDDDCRSGYECRLTGTGGAEAIPNPDRPGLRQDKFCAARR